MAQAVRVRVSLQAPFIMKESDWTEGRQTRVRFFDDTQIIRTSVVSNMSILHTRDEQVVNKKEYFKRKLQGK